MKRPPSSISSLADGLLLGWPRQSLRPFGFGMHQNGAPASGQPLVYRGDNHVIAFSPTSGGKSRSYSIPIQLSYPGSLISLEVKGEGVHVACRQRRRMGQKTVVIDPCRLTVNRSDRLNPFDIFHLPGGSLEDDAEMLASNLAVGHDFSTDRYWNDTATSLIAGLIAHIATTYPPKEQNLNTLRQLLHHDDLDYQLAVWLDEKKVASSLARDEFVAYLAAPSDRTRPCIRSTACTYVKSLGSQQVAEVLSGSSFDLQDVLDGKPVSIWLVIPAEKCDSHRSLLRLWISTLLTTICRRRVIPRQRTLVLLDEAAQLGSLASLRQALTLLRGYGVQMFTCWQDLSQLKLLYPQDWETILNNSGVLALFSLTPLMCRSWSEMLGVEAAELRSMGPDEAFLSTREGYQIIRRPDYLRDPLFAGLFDPNPRYALHALPPAELNGEGHALEIS